MQLSPLSYYSYLYHIVSLCQNKHYPFCLFVVVLFALSAHARKGALTSVGFRYFSTHSLPPVSICTLGRTAKITVATVLANPLPPLVMSTFVFCTLGHTAKITVANALLSPFEVVPFALSESTLSYLLIWHSSRIIYVFGLSNRARVCLLVLGKGHIEL